MTTRKFIFYGNGTKACASSQLSGAWIYYEMASLLTYLCFTGEDMSAPLLSWLRWMEGSCLQVCFPKQSDSTFPAGSCCHCPPCMFLPGLMKLLLYLSCRMGSTRCSIWEVCARLEGSSDFHVVKLVCYWLNVSIKCWQGMVTKQ